MKVWIVTINGKVDNVYTTSRLATDRAQELLIVNPDALVYSCEFKVQGYFEETVV